MTYEVSSTDLDRRIALEFDGIHRDPRVGVNGFFLGRQRSGSTDFAELLVVAGRQEGDVGAVGRRMPRP